MVQKYKLLSVKDGEPKLCAFHFSEQGCKNGTDCKFLHQKPEPKSSGKKKKKSTPTPTPIKHEPITNSDISSESSSDDDSSVDNRQNDSMFFKQTEFKRKPSTKPKKSDMDVAVDQADLKIVYPQPPVQQREDYRPKADNRKERRKQKRKEYEEKEQDSNKKKKSVPIPPPPTDSPFLNVIPATGIFAPAVTSPPQAPQQKTKKSKKKKESTPTAPLGTFASMAVPQKTLDFRSLNLPIASFSAMPQTNVSNTTSSSTVSSEEGEISEEEVEIIRHEEYSKWKLLIDKTKSHPRYETTYGVDTIKRVKENMSNSTPHPWVVPKVFNPDEHSNLPQVIALDCEMCRTKNPKSKNTDSRALCRVSIINGNNPKDDVLLDTLVKPTWPILDDVSFVHGITKNHLKDVKFTMEHVQAFLSSLCTTETIIIGHGIINDFLSMRLDYTAMNNIIDTAFLYNVTFPNPTEEQLAQPSSALPSLQELAATVLTKDMPTIHDSVNDAQATFFCADYYRERNGDVPSIMKTTSNKKYKRDYGRSRRNGNDSNTLFLHRLPANCSTEHIIQLFQIHTYVVPQNVQPINFNELTSVGKTYVLFSSVEHANLAFDSFAGDCVKDASGRNQKRIYLKGGGYICVRKMVMDDNDDDDDGSDSSSDGE